MYLYIDLLTLAVLENPIAIDAGVVGLSLLLLVFLFLNLLLVTQCLAQLRVSPTLIALNALLLRLKGLNW
jgi:hypothetical protein